MPTVFNVFEVLNQSTIIIFLPKHYLTWKSSTKQPTRFTVSQTLFHIWSYQLQHHCTNSQFFSNYLLTSHKRIQDGCRDVSAFACWRSNSTIISDIRVESVLVEAYRSLSIECTFESCVAKYPTCWKHRRARPERAWQTGARECCILFNCTFVPLSVSL